MGRGQRREFLIAAGGLLVASFAAKAQKVAEIPRIGVVSSNAAQNPHLRDAFKQGLRDLGYVEGRDLVLEQRDAAGKLDRLSALLADLVALRVNVILVGGTTQALAAKRATNTIPVVFSTVGDPVGSGLVASLARPGGNLTGLTNVAPELLGKHLDFLKQVVPRASRVAILRQPGALGEGAERELLKGAEDAARTLRLQLQIVDVRGPAEFADAFSEMARARANALAVLGGTMFFGERERLVDLAARNRLPAIYVEGEYADAGGLMSYGADTADLVRRAAAYVDKILNGANPADLPVQQPNKFELIINLTTAKALGLAIPQAVTLRAGRVIE
jgi:putative ABC transport system substrate-binding protein